jgi:O-antigen/teichoic acid export membrane protein
MGVWALFLIVTTIFETTKSALLKGAHIRYMSSIDDTQEKTMIASGSLLINSMISLIVICLLLIFSNNLGIWLHTGPDLAAMLKYFIPGLIAMVIFSHLEATQQGHFDFKGVFAGYFTRQIVFFLLIFFHTIFKIPFTLERLAIYQSISVSLGTIVIYFYTRKYLAHQFNFNTKWIKKLLSYGGYIFSSGIVSNIFLNLDQIMTAAFLSSASVAYYNAASRINQFIDIPSYAASEILFPQVSRASSVDGMDKVKYLFERMASILLSFTVPTALFIIIFPKLVITIIAGSGYIAAAPILQLYMIAGISRPMQNQAANVLNSIGKSRLCFIINLLYLGLNLIVNFTCLHYIGFYGAAVGTLITFLLGSIAWNFVMKKEIGLDWKNVIGYMISFYKNLPNTFSGLIKKLQTKDADPTPGNTGE